MHRTKRLLGAVASLLLVVLPACEESVAEPDTDDTIVCLWIDAVLQCGETAD